MPKSNVVSIAGPEAAPQDVLSEIAGQGARSMLASALNAEVDTFVASHAGLVDADGRQRVVRNGHLPEREIQTSIGEISV